MPTCSRCHEEKPVGEFGKDRTQSGGLSYQCKACVSRRRALVRGTFNQREEKQALTTAGSKRCTKCGEVKLLGEFKLQKRKLGIYPTSWCRACANVASLECMRRLAPAQKAARKEAAKLRPPRPPAIPKNELARKWRDGHRDRLREIQHNYHQTEHGKLKHRLQQHKRRTWMQGVITAEEWLAVLTKHDHRCAYCGVADPKLTIDHVVPLSKGGEHSVSNIVPACLSCNSRKRNRSVEAFLAESGMPRRF